jgi:formylglycine-generating enzyme required for sulfatase activity
MKKAMIVVSVLLLSVLVMANTGAKIEMRNGDVIECEINMESISFITDYGELKIPVSFVREIVFPAPGNRVTTLNTVFPNETFGGFLLDEYIFISLLGNPIRFHKDAIGKIRIYNDSQIIAKEVVQANLKTGDIFYGEMLSTGIKIQTSYGEFEIVTENIEGMEFEGEGNVLTKIKLNNKSEMRGTIKDDFIVFKLLSGSELSVSPGKIRSIVFLKEEEPIINAEATNHEDTSRPVSSEETKDISLTDSTSHPENMVLVERGSFTMGDTWGDGESDEKPTHKVTFTYDFYIGKYETTFDEYDAFCEATGRSKPDDKGWGRGQRPVINVSWWDAIAYCNWLSEKEGLHIAYNENGNLLDEYGRLTTDPSKVTGYRLPTEAEWEYAAHGGNKSAGYKYAGSNSVGEVAWYYINSGGNTDEVGKKQSNELGIYDMSGNVWEWCSDWYGDYSVATLTNPYNNSGNYRVNRGGSFYHYATFTRVARRYYVLPAYMVDDLGFRICRTAP